MREMLETLDPSPIQEAELFSALSQEEREFVASRSSVLQLRQGALLFSSGEQADHFYMLLRGSVRVSQSRFGGTDNETARFKPMDILGDFDFARGAKYDAYAEAAEDSVLIMFPGFGLTMDALAAENPRRASKILLGCLQRITFRIKATQKIILENMSWIQELHRRAYEDSGTGLWNQSFLTNELNRILENPTALILLKPDRFKTLVDSRGHITGDEAMISIAQVLKNAVRRVGQGWALRFKSNETGILIPKCDAASAEKIARELAESIASLEPLPALGNMPVFTFSGTLSWAVWPEDNPVWDSLFQENYELLLDAWRAGGNRLVRYHQGKKP
ncbi:MAG: diguanylate cyclase [Treponema sp.]|jgi:diguanylate cyclase (GGDEF)-like protein|nr:diguanylate cyclase [Treponema sp.]